VPSIVPLEPGSRVPILGREVLICTAESGPAPVFFAEGNRLCVRGRPEHRPRRIVAFLKKEAKSALDTCARAFAERLGVRATRIGVRDTASRWGSCAASGALSFSWRLIFAPRFVLEYVVAHEIAHLREMNHGARFWSLVRLLVDDIEKPQLWLRQNGVALHRYAPVRRRTGS
jgi:predicted metal-dependent hydrolase